MNEIELFKAINTIDKEEIPSWKIDLMAARQDITFALLVASYHALGINPPTDDIMSVRAAQIAEKADVCNRDLKDAFDRAVDAKMEREIKTPITYGDINKAAILNATEKNKSVVGKWKHALPNLKDKALWGETVCSFALSHGKAELEAMMQKRLTNDR